MNETTLDWDDFRLFLAVARHGGLAAAEQETGKSAPTLARRMLALERDLQQDLFERTHRGYVLTPNGNALLTRIEALESGIRPLLTSTGSAVQRRVKVSAGTWTTYHVLPKLVRLLSDQAIVVQFISADRVLDIPHREAVIGVRNQRPDQVSLAGKQLGPVRFAAYAKEADTEEWIIVGNNTPSANWVAENHSKTLAVEVSSPRNALDLATMGMGRIVLPTFIGDNENRLIRVSDNIDALEHNQWLVCHQEDRQLPEVRCVLDMLGSVLMQA